MAERLPDAPMSDLARMPAFDTFSLAGSRLGLTGLHLSAERRLVPGLRFAAGIDEAKAPSGGAEPSRSVLGDIELQHPITGEPVPRDKIDRRSINGLVREVRAHFKERIKDVLQRYRAGEDRAGLVSEIENDALRDVYDLLVEIVKWFGAINNAGEGFTIGMRHRVSRLHGAYKALTTYIRHNLLDRFMAEGRVNESSEQTNVYSLVNDIRAILGDKIKAKGVSAAIDVKALQEATVPSTTDFAAREDAGAQGWPLTFTSRPGETVFRLRMKPEDGHPREGDLVRLNSDGPPDPLLAMPGPDGASPLEGTTARIAAAEGRWSGGGRTFGVDGANGAGKGSASAVIGAHLLVTGITEESQSGDIRAAAQQTVDLLKVLDMNMPPADWTANLIIANALIDAFGRIAEMEPALRRKIVAHIVGFWDETGTLQKRLNHADILKQAMDKGYKGSHWRFRLGLYNGRPTDVKREGGQTGEIGQLGAASHPREGGALNSRDSRFRGNDISGGNDSSGGNDISGGNEKAGKDDKRPRKKKQAVPAGYEGLFNDLMAHSPEFLKVYQEEGGQERIWQIFASHFGTDIGRKRIARGHLPWLLRGGIGGNGGMDKDDVPFAVQHAWPFLTDGEKEMLGELAHGVRLALIKRLDIGRLRELDTVAHDVPAALARIVKLVPREITGGFYPGLEAALREGLVRYLFGSQSQP